MPYIEQCDRDILNAHLKPLINHLKGHEICFVVGLINYCVSQILISIWKATPKYSVANALIGSLECTKMEFIRRYVNKYEDEKIVTNGDIEGL